MPVKKRIAFLNCYFGKLPWYFSYFVHTCKYNPHIDFFIVTDHRNNTIYLPDNVKLIHQSLEDINNLATRKLGIATNIHDGYKLCDFKPAYGLVFEDLIKEYEFWGINDIDIILGNVANFITDDVLDAHEVMAVRDDYITGYFSIFKNTEKINTLFRHSKDHELVLSNERHFCFDETNFKHKEFALGMHYAEVDTEIESMTHVVRRLQESGDLKPYFEWHAIEACPGDMKWDTGTLSYKGEFEAILYHLITLKETYRPTDINPGVPDVFSVSPTQILHH